MVTQDPVRDEMFDLAERLKEAHRRARAQSHRYGLVSWPLVLK